jgi:hypothetical protein
MNARHHGKGWQKPVPKHVFKVLLDRADRMSKRAIHGPSDEASRTLGNLLDCQEFADFDTSKDMLRLDSSFDWAIAEHVDTRSVTERIQSGS